MALSACERAALASSTKICPDHAACDQNCADKSGDVVLVDDQGRSFKIANQDKVKGLASKKAKMKCRPVKGEKDTMYVDTVSLYGG
jgi:hypothetical protein